MTPGNTPHLQVAPFDSHHTLAESKSYSDKPATLIPPANTSYLSERITGGQKFLVEAGLTTHKNLRSSRYQHSSEARSPDHQPGLWEPVGSAAIPCFKESAKPVHSFAR